MMTTRIAILGSTGMLGHAVANAFKNDERFCVTTFCRNPQDNERLINASSADLSVLTNFDYVINCIGIIKQIKFANRCEMFIVNSVFPWLLQEKCREIGARLLHVTSDCVFSGKVGMYSESDTPDADDDYGLSKSCGEPNGAMVFRTSIIGYELRGKLSLLEWIISNKGKRIDGYTNHIWSGLTTTELARVFIDVIVNDMFQAGVYHIHSNNISKYDLACLINETLDLGITITPTQTTLKCDRSLVSKHPLNDLLKIPSVTAMIKALKDDSQ